MINFKKKIIYIFLFTFFITGSIASLNVGISHDEYHEEENWKYNLNLSKKFYNDLFSFEANQITVIDYKDKYYGIGFQIVSQPIQFIIKGIVADYLNVDIYGAKLISKHIVVFLFFFISGLTFYLILRKIIKNKNFCYLSTLIYFFYPYLLGHSFFNSKDIPFMSIWLLCSYFCYHIFEKFNKNKIVNQKYIFILGILTAYLLSIRVSGILIFFQYFITFLLFINSNNYNYLKFFKTHALKLFQFLIFVLFFTYLFHPVYWSNPFEIINAIKSMSYFFNDICTQTLGSCMKAKDLPSTYIPIWLSVKLPLMILIGILLIPLVEKKIFTSNDNKIIFGSILITTFLIPLLMIVGSVHLYDEIRHLMFLMPFFITLGVVSIFIFSKKFFYLFGIFTISFFIYENIKINPYQYIWFNLPSRFLDLTNHFELDYQGLSGKEIASKIPKISKEKNCILTSPIYSVRPFLNDTKFDCFDIWQYVDTGYQRPFLAVQHVRNIKKGIPYNCVSIYESSFNLLLHKKKFVTGKLLKCS